MATKKKAKSIDGVKKPKKDSSKKLKTKTKKTITPKNTVKDAIISHSTTTPEETHISITEIDTDAKEQTKKPATPKSSKTTEKPASKIDVAITEEPISIAVSDASDDPTEIPEEPPVAPKIPEPSEDAPENSEEESEAVEIPVSTKDITVAISSPVAEDLDEYSDDDDIEALINDVTEEKHAKDAKTEEVTEDGTSDQQENLMKKAKKAPRKAKPFRILSRLIALTATGLLIALLVRVVTTGVLPSKYTWISACGIAVVSLFLLFKAFRKKTHLKMLAFTNLIGIGLIAASIFGLIKIEETMHFLDDNLNSNKEYSIYNIIVSKKSNYNNIHDIKGKTFHSISDFIDTKKLEEAAKDQADATIAYADGITSLLKNTLDDTTYIAVLNSGTYNAALENDDSKTYEKGLKVIGELKVEVEKTTRSNDSDLTENSFVIYISGIDTRSGMMVDKSLSDVNIIMAVNPKTKHILLVAVPRDYYIQLHGTSGLPDKLTHAGSLGGLELSMATIEDLLGIQFDHHLRVNFNAVIGLVDAIGGITVYSDVDYPITAWTDRNCTFQPGNNDLTGKCALAFARERYSYQTGDRHRGENQEQVIQKIIEKITKSSTLISNYSNILNALSGSFETSIATKDITSLVNMQLSDMSGWTIETYNLDGTTGGAYTYSYPSQQLSVMYPDQATVEIAKKKIAAVLEGVDYVDDTAPTTEAIETTSN